MRNTGRQYRQILFELKQPPRLSEEEVSALLASAIYSTSRHRAPSRTAGAVWDSFEPGGGAFDEVHHHVLDYVFSLYTQAGSSPSHHDGRPGLATPSMAKTT